MKFFKYILFVIFITSYSATYSQQFWLKKNSPTTDNLRKCYFIDSLTGWAVGDSGIIIHTTDKGMSWSIQESHIKSFFTAIFFLNPRLGWGTAWTLYTDTSFYGSIILKTTNGGLTWDSTRYTAPNIYLKSIYFFDSLNGYMAGTPANFIKTTDGGNNWIPGQTDSTLVSTFPVNGFCFYNRTYGFAYGGVMDMGGIVWKTTDGGNFWQSSIVASEPLYKMILFDSLHLIGIGGDFEYGPSVINTNNSGVNWSYKSLGILGVANSLSFRTNKEAWTSLGGTMQMIYSLDTCKTWTAINSPDSSVINDLTFTDYRNGYAFGDNGVILKFNTDFVGIIKNNISILPEKTELFQNYPNPFNPVTNIKYSINHSSRVIIKIFDLLGREIQSLDRGFQKEGFYTYTFNAVNLSSGVYFYRLIAISTDINNSNEYIETHKMVLLK